MARQVKMYVAPKKQRLDICIIYRLVDSRAKLAGMEFYLKRNRYQCAVGFVDTSSAYQFPSVLMCDKQIQLYRYFLLTIAKMETCLIPCQFIQFYSSLLELLVKKKYNSVISCICNHEPQNCYQMQGRLYFFFFFFFFFLKMLLSFPNKQQSRSKFTDNCQFFFFDSLHLRDVDSNFE